MVGRLVRDNKRKKTEKNITDRNKNKTINKKI